MKTERKTSIKIKIRDKKKFTRNSMGGNFPGGSFPGDNFP